jgi:putative holliday junction resolvase
MDKNYHEMENSNGRYMAFDFGSKRTGIAVTDPFRIIATPLTTLDPNLIIPFLIEYQKTEIIAAFIVGLPLQMDNSPSEISPQVELFIKLLKKSFLAIPVFRMDERFTSKMATRTILEGGLKKKSRRDKSLVDKISATLILQSYLAFESAQGL